MGKPLRKAKRRLAQRIETYERMSGKRTGKKGGNGYKRPGSMKK